MVSPLGNKAPTLARAHNPRNSQPGKMKYREMTQKQGGKNPAAQEQAAREKWRPCGEAERRFALLRQ